MSNPTKTTNDQTVCGKQIQHDASGVGHAWRSITRDDIPADIIEEIEGEILDGDKDSCSDFIGSNGLHYRWTSDAAVAAYDVVRYHDGQVIGTMNLTAKQFAAYEQRAQQPEGLIRLSDLPHAFYEACDEYDNGKDSHEDTTVYLD